MQAKTSSYDAMTGEARAGRHGHDLQRQVCCAREDPPMSICSPLHVLVCAAAVTVTLAATQPRSTLAPVRTQQGLVVGSQASPGVAAYLGLPYAAPPVGENRWRPPQPVAAWDGVRQATAFGTSCMQQQTMRLGQTMAPMPVASPSARQFFEQELSK
jgi:para-nitrobenzyl esterase